MKKLILALSVLLPLSSFADGVPVPMDKQTPYNWACEPSEKQKVSLHLMTDDSTLYVSYWGGTIGTGIKNDKIAIALVNEDYDKLDGTIVKDKDFKRQLEFIKSGNKISVRMTDPQYKMSFLAINCVKY